MLEFFVLSRDSFFFSRNDLNGRETYKVSGKVTVVLVGIGDGRTPAVSPLTG